MKINHINFIIVACAILFAGCKKEGEFVLKPVKALKPFDIKGYVVADTLEQYFDGVKVRDLYGKVSLAYVTPQIAFQNDVAVMQLKKKSTKEVVYEQKFSIADAKNEVANFYFDGTKVSKSYQYPKPEGSDYMVNFYFDGPKGMPSVDIGIDVLEYYMDANNKVIVVHSTSFPIAENLQRGKWSEYLKISPPPPVIPTQSGTDLYPVVTIRDAKTKKYLIGNNFETSTIQMEIPDQWTSQGKVQSIHIQQKGAEKNVFMEINDLVQLFP
uniref:hypothetical protein n=1 Tax=Pedobacter schmidteae TaxID=2201271 RepID=UPI000EAFD6C5|nr:hypothetical protein [Pedobacter schmidteae]